MAKGFSQRRDIDYEDTFFLVVRHSTLHLLFALTVQIGMNILDLDVATTFLNRHLKENIYMSILQGFVSKGNSDVLKLKKPIYGLNNHH